MAAADHAALILANTALGTAPLVPELRVHLLTADSPLWVSFSDGPEKDSIPRPYWAFAWSGGQALARYVLDHPDVVRGKQVLDFGAGGGLAAIAALRAGAAQVLAADVDPVAISTATLNAAANGVPLATTTEDLIYTPNPGWEVVLAGDIWYNSRLARHGLAWLRTLAAQGVLVLAGDPGRLYSPAHGLAPRATYPCRSVPDLEHPNLQDVRVSQVLPKAG